MKNTRRRFKLFLVLAAVGFAGSALAAPPPNDDFANAQLLSGVSGHGTAVTAEATVEAGEPPHSDRAPSHSVWYRWTAPASNTLVFQKQDPVNGTYLGFYTGTAFVNLSEIRKAPNDSNFNQYAFHVDQGVTYYICFNDPIENGRTFQFGWQLIEGGNDSFAAAQTIGGASGSVIGTVLSATVEPSEPNAGAGSTVWYAWMAPSTGSFRFDISGQVNTYRIYTGETIDRLSEQLNLDYYSGLRATAGIRYYIQVSGIGSSYVSNGFPTFTLSWSAGPPNDDMANAITISGAEGSVAGNTRGGTHEPGEPTISGYVPTESIWYAWTPSTTRWYSFRVDTGFAGLGAPLLAAYTGTAIDGLKQVASAVNGSFDLSTRRGGATITFRAEAGMPYRISVAVKSSYMNVSPRDLTLSWKQGTSSADAAIVNLSTRARVGVDADVLIGGFIIKGNAPKKLMIRGIGPSLQVSGAPIPDRLLDPTLELHQSGGDVIFSNDNWADSPQKQAIADSAIAPSDEREAAIIATLAPGAYTAVLRGASNSFGTALVEIYDLDVTADSRLLNISTRGRVDDDPNVMIGGFIVGGSLPAKVAVRALGPSLANANPPVAGVLSDPSIELRDSSQRIDANSSWTSPYSAAITDAGLAPANTREAALITTLNPGAYTAVIRGENKSTGVGLVEVYNLN